MSHVPYYLPNARAGMRYGHGQVLDGLIKDGLWDVYNDVHMVSPPRLPPRSHSAPPARREVLWSVLP